jgi:hypothetical protein
VSNRVRRAAVWLAQNAPASSLTGQRVASHCSARDCESLSTTAPEAVVSALDPGDIKTEDRSRVAFQRIEQLPRDASIPILIRRLGFRRPIPHSDHTGCDHHTQRSIPSTMLVFLPSLR